MRLIALLLMALSIPALAGQSPQSEGVQEASDLLRKMSYRKALATVEKVLAAPESGPAELVESYRIQGLILAALNRKKESVEAFRRLLAIQPSFRLPKSISPKLRTPFYQAVGMAVDQQGIGVAHSPPQVSQQLGGTRMRAKLTADPLKMVVGLRLRYLSKGEVKDLSVLVHGPKTVAFKLPDGYEGEAFRYWLEAFNVHGGVLASAGSRAEPFELIAKPQPAPVIAPVAISPPPTAVGASAPPPEDPANVEEGSTWYRSWWFWTVVGVVAAGAVTGGVLAGTAGGDPDPLHWNVRVR